MPVAVSQKICTITSNPTVGSSLMSHRRKYLVFHCTRSRIDRFPQMLDGRYMGTAWDGQSSSDLHTRISQSIITFTTTRELLMFLLHCLRHSRHQGIYLPSHPLVPQWIKMRPSQPS